MIFIKCQGKKRESKETSVKQKKNEKTEKVIHDVWISLSQKNDVWISYKWVD